MTTTPTLVRSAFDRVAMEDPVPDRGGPDPDPASRERSLLGRVIATVRDDVRELIRYRQVIHDMVVQNLRVRYQRSVLGFLWTLLNPILMLTVLAIVFSSILRFAIEGYTIYLFAGLVPWALLSGSINDCSQCIIVNEGLIKKVYLPKLVFPVASVLLNLVTVVLSMTAMFLLVVPLGSRPCPSMLLLPVVALLFAAFSLGLGMAVAAANTFYRDIGHVTSIALQAWYFLTPIIYPLHLALDRLGPWVWLNPAYYFINMFQVIIRENAWPARSTLMVATLLALASLAFGYAIFKRAESRLVFRL